MDLKRLITHFAYRIEPKPEGGFIAHATDPSVPPIEAPTRLELQQKIQQNIVSALSAEFPALKLALENKQTELNFHVERKPDGGFAIHSADPNVGVIEGASQAEVESHFLEKFLGFAGKHLMPEFSQALASQVNSGNIKVVVNRKTAITFNSGSHKMNLGTSQNPTLNGFAQPKDSITPADLGVLNGTLDNAPITPESSNVGKVFRLILALLIVGAMVYFFLRYR
jgi:hypothetical protein